MRQTSLSLCVPRVSWESGYVNFTAHKGETAGVWVVPRSQLSRNVGAGLETKQCLRHGSLTLLHKNSLLLLLTASSCAVTIQNAHKTLQHGWYPPCSPNVSDSLGGELFDDVLPSLIKSNTWSSVFTACPASLSSNTQQRNQAEVFVSNCICLLYNCGD